MLSYKEFIAERVSPKHNGGPPGGWPDKYYAQNSITGFLAEWTPKTRTLRVWDKYGDFISDPIGLIIQFREELWSMGSLMASNTFMDEMSKTKIASNKDLAKALTKYTTKKWVPAPDKLKESSSNWKLHDDGSMTHSNGRIKDLVHITNNNGKITLIINNKKVDGAETSDLRAVNRVRLNIPVKLADDTFEALWKKFIKSFTK